LGQSSDPDRDAAGAQLPRHDIAIAAIIARATEYQCRHGTGMSPDGGGGGLPRSLHQLLERVTLCDGRCFGDPHLPGCQDRATLHSVPTRAGRRKLSSPMDTSIRSSAITLTIAGSAPSAAVTPRPSFAVRRRRKPPSG